MYKILKLLFSLTILIFVVVYFVKNDFVKPGPVLYTNANIITLNEKQPFANSMYVVDGKIRAIGTASTLRSHLRKETAIVDLKGKTVLPGFIDPHTHFSISMFLAEMHDLSGFRFNSNEQIWNEFKNIVTNTKSGDWIICKGLDPVLVSDLEVPSIEYLDAIAPNNPTLFFSQSLHNYWANSKAFALVGITDSTTNPSKHSYYGRDVAGRLDGSIVEQEAVKPFFDILKEEVLTPNRLSDAATLVMEEYAKNGNTTIVSTGITIQDEKPLLLFEHLSSEHLSFFGGVLEKLGFLPKRKPYPRHFIYMRHDMEHLLPKTVTTNDFYNIIGLKLWYDGSPYVGSMYLKEPYLDSKLTNATLHIPKNHRGEALLGGDVFKNCIRKYHKKGWQIAIHTQGDAAISEVVSVFETLSNELDFSNSRHRLEHCLLLPKKDLLRMQKLQLSPSFHINHLYYYGDALKNKILGEERVEKLLPVQSALEMGIKMSLHADQPMFKSSPFQLIQTAVERKTITGDTIAKQEQISLMDGLRAMTIDAAWQIHMEDKIGSLEIGKYADFIVVDKNPLEIQVAELHSIQCLQTYVNGALVK